jgi:alkylated DNA repair protein alkB family protein 8
LENVQRVYDAVAKQWHGTRYRAWSGVEDFVNRMNLRGALVADVGCGNGKNAPAVVRFGQTRGGAEVIGCDFSIPLLEICATERGDERVEAFAADAASLPMRSSCFDAALNIAVLHHASTSFRRRALVSETMRLLRVGGVALFYAWALEQETGGVSGHRFESQDVLVPFHKRAETVGKKKKEKTLSEDAEDGDRDQDQDAKSAREKTKKSLGLGSRAGVSAVLPRVQGGRARVFVRPPPRVVQGGPRVLRLRELVRGGDAREVKRNDRRRRRRGGRGGDAKKTFFCQVFFRVFKTFKTFKSFNRLPPFTWAEA